MDTSFLVAFVKNNCFFFSYILFTLHELFLIRMQKKIIITLPTDHSTLYAKENPSPPLATKNTTNLSDADGILKI